MDIEKLPQYENNEIAISVLRDEVLAIESRIDELYKKKGADPKGVHFAESMEIPIDWLEFVEKVDDVLLLSKEESEESMRLIEKFFQGKLNDEGNEGDLEALLLLRARFNASKGYGNSVH